MAKGLSKMAISLNLFARPTSAPDQNFRMVLSFDLRLGRPLKTREMQRKEIKKNVTQNANFEVYFNHFLTILTDFFHTIDDFFTYNTSTDIM